MISDALPNALVDAIVFGFVKGFGPTPIFQPFAPILLRFKFWSACHGSVYEGQGHLCYRQP